MSSSSETVGGKRVVVIGAGAAGLMAAAEAAKRGAAVQLVEKSSKTGVKILMSGGTRCNLTHDTNAKGITTAFGHAQRFLQPSVGAFPPTEVVAMFHRLGVATKVENTGKIFPQSDRALHVRDALHKQAIDYGVKIHLSSGVETVDRSAGTWQVRTATGEFECDCVIVTSGGKSYPGCGTTGDGYGWLQRLGHSIIRPRPALVPLVGGNEWTQSLSGLTIPDCTASVLAHQSNATKPVLRRRGGWLFTHFGFSGPAAMDVSGTMTAAETFDQVRLQVDWLPDQTEAELLQQLRDRSAARGKRKVSSLLGQWLPRRLVAAIVESTAADTSLAQLPKGTLHRLAQQLKAMEMPVTATRGFEKAEVTAGGVKLSEVNPRTLESRLVDGLYIAGEVLDVDGWIGGYNFQAAFSTGRAAGIAAATSVQ